MYPNERLFLGLLLLGLAPNVYAYLDPGTGSLFVQGLIAAVAMAGVTLRLYWQRFLAVFRRPGDVAEEEQNDVSDSARQGPDS